MNYNSTINNTDKFSGGFHNSGKLVIIINY